jgi:peptide/nickel transport system substrate-binding protein
VKETTIMDRLRFKAHLIGSLVLVAIVVAGAAPSSNAGAQSSRAVSAFHESIGWTANGVFNPFSPNGIPGFDGLTDNRLAYFVRATRSYIPQLAVSWHTSPTQLVVNLRHGVVWHDDMPLTSKDVVTTFLGVGVAFGSRTGLWNDLASVHARGPYQIVFTLRPHVNVNNAVYQLLATQNIYPDHVWGRYLPANTASLVQSNNTAALQKVSQALIKAAPPRWIGSGPFQMTTVTSGQIILTKFPKFWLANKIRAPQIILDQATSNTACWSQMLSGWSDFDWCASPMTVQQQWLSKPDNHMALPWDYSIYGVYFNNRRYPLSLPAFRQALAYLIDRPQVTQIADPTNVPDKVPTALLPPVAQQWLSRSDLAHLNPYTHNPAKAAALLKSIGFKKTAAGWVTPQGKPVALTLIAPAGWTSSVILMEAIASEMKQFGFKDVTATSREQPGYWADQLNGNFDISWGWAGWWTLDPIQEFYGTFVGQNFASPQQKGIGFGPTVTLNGFGTVNLATFLKKMSATNDKATLSKAVKALAQMENQQLPMLPVEVKRLQTFYSSRTYTNWPAPNHPLWSDVGGWAMSALSLMMQKGYILPK